MLRERNIATPAASLERQHQRLVGAQRWYPALRIELVHDVVGYVAQLDDAGVRVVVDIAGESPNRPRDAGWIVPRA